MLQYFLLTYLIYNNFWEKIYKSSILLFLYLIKIATGKYRMFTFRKPFFCVVVWNAFKGEGLILSQKSCPSQNYNFQWNVWSMIKTIANHSSACTKPIGPVGPGHIFGASRKISYHHLNEDIVFMSWRWSAIKVVNDLAIVINSWRFSYSIKGSWWS